MRFFGNSDINKLYMHSGLHAFAEYTGGIFVFVYLLKQGLTPSLVLLALAGFTCCRLIFRQGLVPFALRYGLRSGLVAGTVLTAFGYVALAFSHGLDWGLLGYVVIGAFGESWYWASMHANAATLGDVEQRGTQVSAVQVIYALNGIIGPLIGAFMLSHFGPMAGFAVSFCSQLCAAVPLLFTTNRAVAAEPQLNDGDLRFAWRVYFCDGFATCLSTMIWGLALFLLLGSSYENFGLAIALAALAGAGMSLVLGRLIDLGHGEASTRYGIGGWILVVILRCAFIWSPFLSVVTNALGAIAGPLYGAAYNSRVYNLAKHSGDPLRFHVMGEGGWDTGATISALLGAALLYVGVPTAFVMALGITGTIGVMLVLLKSYEKEEPSLRV